MKRLCLGVTFLFVLLIIAIPNSMANIQLLSIDTDKDEYDAGESIDLSTALANSNEFSLLNNKVHLKIEDVLEKEVSVLSFAAREVKEKHFLLGIPYDAKPGEYKLTMMIYNAGHHLEAYAETDIKISNPSAYIGLDIEKIEFLFNDGVGLGLEGFHVELDKEFILRYKATNTGTVAFGALESKLEIVPSNNRDARPITYSQDFSLGLGENKEIVHKLRLSKPGSYTVFINLLRDDKTVTRKEARVVVEGASATVVGLENPENTYQQGETVEINAKIIGSADYKTVINNPDVTLEVVQDSEVVYSETQTIDSLDSNFKDVVFSFLAPIDLTTYSVKVSLESEGNMLDDLDLGYAELKAEKILMDDGRVKDLSVRECFDDGVCDETETSIGNCYDCWESTEGDMDSRKVSGAEDDDNDGFSNREEIKKGTDPNDPESHPVKRKGLFIIIAVTLVVIVGVVVLNSFMKSRRRINQPPVASNAANRVNTVGRANVARVNTTRVNQVGRAYAGGRVAVNRTNAGRVNTIARVNQVGRTNTTGRVGVNRTNTAGRTNTANRTNYASRRNKVNYVLFFVLMNMFLIPFTEAAMVVAEEGVIVKNVTLDYQAVGMFGKVVPISYRESGEYGESLDDESVVKTKAVRTALMVSYTYDTAEQCKQASQVISERGSICTSSYTPGSWACCASTCQLRGDIQFDNHFVASTPGIFYPVRSSNNISVSFGIYAPACWNGFSSSMIEVKVLDEDDNVVKEKKGFYAKRGTMDFVGASYPIMMPEQTDFVETYTIKMTGYGASTHHYNFASFGNNDVGWAIPYYFPTSSNRGDAYEECIIRTLNNKNLELPDDLYNDPRLAPNIDTPEGIDTEHVYVPAGGFTARKEEIGQFTNYPCDSLAVDARELITCMYHWEECMNNGVGECVCCNKGTGGHYGQTGKKEVIQPITIYRRCTAGEDWISDEGQWICDEGQVYRCEFGPDSATSSFVERLEKGETRDIGGMNYTCMNPEWMLDTDGDKDPDGTDCDIIDPDVYTDAEEVCDNGIDDDCDEDVDYDDSGCVCTSCSSCGSGLINLCDRVECGGCGSSSSCYYQAGLIGGNCGECNSSVKCSDYGSDQTSCTDDPCLLENCFWDTGSGDCCPDFNGDTLVSCGGNWPDYCEPGKEWVSLDMKVVCRDGLIETCDNSFTCRENYVVNETFFCNGTEWTNLSECSISGDCTENVYWLADETACCLSGSSCARLCDSGKCNQADNKWCDSGAWSSEDYCAHCSDSDCATCTEGDCDVFNEKICSAGVWVTPLSEADYCINCGTLDSGCLSSCSLAPDECDTVNNKLCNSEEVWSSTDYCYNCAGSDIDCVDSVDPDYSIALCEYVSSGVQGNCTTDVSGCWDPDGNPGFQCCGDDTGESWSDPIGYMCYDGTFHTDADDIDYLCEMVEEDIQENCEHDETGCWDPVASRCCGDDLGETWDYSTNENIDELIVGETCYNGRWYNRELGDVTFYELDI